MFTLSKTPLNRKIAIAIAVSAMWLLGGLGIYLLHRSDRWFFIDLKGYDATTLIQIGAYYFACVGAQLPALWVAAVIIAMSDFHHPVRTACFVTLGLQGVLFVARSFMWQWSKVTTLDQSIPLLAELVYMALLVGHAVLLTWLVTGPLARFFRRPFKSENPSGLL